MSDKYPKVTQEGLDAAVTVLLGNMQQQSYLKDAPYSALMCDKIKQVTEKFRSQLELGNLNSTGDDPDGDVDDEKENEEIKKQFSDINESLETRSGEYRDKYGILHRFEKIVRSMERMSRKGSSDTVKMSAMTKFMDFQQQQMEVLMQLTNVEKAQKIEALTRRFFQEIRKTESLKKIADRYLAMLNELD